MLSPGKRAETPCGVSPTGPCPGYRLRLLHRESGCSTLEISAILEISPRAYSYYESGQRQIGLDGVIALARFYDVSMDYICGLTDYRGEFPHY